MRTKRRFSSVLGLTLALALVATACGNDDDTSAGEDDGGPTTETPATTDGNGDGGDAMADVEGDVFISGSSTVEPISLRVAELFEDVAPGVSVDVEGPGTGDGFQKFCAGDSDISDASRPIQEAEAEACADAGIEYIELKVGVDGIAVMGNPDNPLECLNFADLYAIVGPESDGVDTWTEAGEQAAELGSDTEFPEADLEITAPGGESGTYDSFIEIALEGLIEEQLGEEHLDGGNPLTRLDYAAQSDDNIIIQAMQGSLGAFGWVGFAFAEGADGVKLFQVDDGESGCVAPTSETIASNEYPISRDLYIYVNAAQAEENEALAAFVDYYVGDGIVAVTDVGYVALTDDSLESTRTRWEDRETGTAA